MPINIPKSRPKAALLAAAVLTLLCAAGCAESFSQGADPGGPLFAPGRWLALRTNLHPSERGIISAMNYQPQAVLPVCTEVFVTDINDKEMTFQVGEKSYVWQFDERIREDPLRHLAHFFAPQCERRSLSQLDRQGIRQGKPKVGMSRWGIFYAMGYPPDDITPDSRSNVWNYWSYKNVRTQIVFENEVVVAVRKHHE